MKNVIIAIPRILYLDVQGVNTSFTVTAHARSCPGLSINENVLE